MKSETCFLRADTGTTIDEKTCYTAGIMLLSLIPYIIVQLVYVFDSSFGNRMVILITLILSTVMLLSYFVYQVPHSIHTNK